MKRNPIALAIGGHIHADGTFTYVKGGQTAGFSAVIAWNREQQIGVVILTNRGNLSLEKLGLELLDALIPK